VIGEAALIALEKFAFCPKCVLTRKLIPQMKSRRWGRIIHISSIVGLGGIGGPKSALIGMTRASAIDLGPFRITVNCIAPGPFLTDLPGKLLSEEENVS
jgi:NAD(P)-dependent dehydrogenase (short-subunit alcohol dehydrogenase family)